MSAIDAISARSLTLSDRRPQALQPNRLGVDGGSVDGEQTLPDATPVQFPLPGSSLASGDPVGLFGSAGFAAALALPELPPPPPLPRPSAELLWITQRTWTPPESDLKLKDLSV